MLVGVSSGRGGVYPISQMRLMGYKNNHYVISPESLIVQDVKNVMNNSNEPENKGDEYIRDRAKYAIKILAEYAKSLKLVRDSGVIDFDTYPNGL
jgi:hypothetical protein